MMTGKKRTETAEQAEAAKKTDVNAKAEAGKEAAAAGTEAGKEADATGTDAESELTLEEAFAKLEEVTDALEQWDISLEDSFALYQKGMELVKQCGKKIDMVEKQVLMMDEEGELSEF